MQKYAGTWVFTCRNVGRGLYGRRGEVIVEAENLERATVEVCKAGARELFNGAPGMYPNFVAENVQLAVLYEGTWVCKFRHLGLYRQRGKAQVLAGSVEQAARLVRIAGAQALFGSVTGLETIFLTRRVKVYTTPAGKPAAPA